MRKMSVYRA